MSDHFIVVGQQAINLAHVIKTQYTPAYAGGEQDDEQAAGVLTQPRQARIDVTTTERDWDRDRMDNIVPRSVTETFRGDEADAIWGYLKHIGSDVMGLAARRRKAMQETLAASEQWKAGRR